MSDPFATLGLAPTTELGQVKRAWFSALPKHPPEADPDGFRRLRDAYEQLIRPGGLMAAYAAAPVDLAAVSAQYEARFESAIQAAASAVVERQSTSQAVQQFVERYSGQAWDEVLGNV